MCPCVAAACPPYPGYRSSAATAMRTGLSSCPRRAKAALIAAVGARLQEIHFDESGSSSSHEDELCDPHPNHDLEGLVAVVVYEGDPYLTAIPGVYETGRVDERDTVPHGQTAARQDEPRIPFRYGYRDPGPGQSPSAGSKARRLHGAQVIARVAGMRSGRLTGIGMEAAEKNLRSLGSHTQRILARLPKPKVPRRLPRLRVRGPLASSSPASEARVTGSAEIAADAILIIWKRRENDTS